MTSFVLLFPGDSSDWISLADYAGRRGDEADSDGARRAYNELARRLGDLAIKVRVVSPDTKYRLLIDGAGVAPDAGDRLLQSAAIDRKWLQAGLADLRGAANLGGHAPTDDCVLDALAASGVQGLIADVIVSCQGLQPSEQAAFFTRAAVAPSGSAASAQTGAAPSSDAPPTAPAGNHTS